MRRPDPAQKSLKFSVLWLNGSKFPTESSCRQSRPVQSSSASRGCVHVHAPDYRWVNFGSFAKACHGKSFYSGFLLFLEQQGEHEYYSLTKKIRRVPHFLQPPAIDKEPESNANMHVTQRRDEMARI